MLKMKLCNVPFAQKRLKTLESTLKKCIQKTEERENQGLTLSSKKVKTNQEHRECKFFKKLCHIKKLKRHECIHFHFCFQKNFQKLIQEI